TRMSALTKLLVIGADDRAPYIHYAEKLSIADRVTWLPWGTDVLDGYAAADAYVSPSREDSFALPVLEAMACGLPVVTSIASGASELVEDGINGFVLQDPSDAQTLAGRLTRLSEDEALRTRLGQSAVLTARKYSWDLNAALVWDFLRAATNRQQQG